MAEPERHKIKLGSPWNRQEVEWTHEEIIEFRRSRVRMWTTYLAMAYLFVFGGLFVGSLLFGNWMIPDPDATEGTRKVFDTYTFDAAKEIFTLILPVATGIVGFWFAGRGAGKKPTEK